MGFRQRHLENVSNFQIITDKGQGISSNHFFLNITDKGQRFFKYFIYISYFYHTSHLQKYTITRFRPRILFIKHNIY